VDNILTALLAGAAGGTVALPMTFAVMWWARKAQGEPQINLLVNASDIDAAHAALDAKRHEATKQSPYL
jgi:hypothetical protein